MFREQSTTPPEEHLVDLFCGAGGSGGGLLEACEILNHPVKGTFVNHWDKAIEIHEANHPQHRHFEEDIFLLDPEKVFPKGVKCGLLWASPQCTFFSSARGAACINEQDRSHAHNVTDWIRHLNPECIQLENVPEFRNWGATMHKRQPSHVQKEGKRKRNPQAGELMWAFSAKPVRNLPRGFNRQVKKGETEEQWSARMLKAGYTPYEVPDPARKNEYFDAWVQEVRNMGYEVEWRILQSCAYGDPTIRKRLFLYCVRRDTGKSIVWPDPTHFKVADASSQWGWRSARECIDWSIQGKSMFNRKKPMAPNTLRRAAIGLVKYGFEDLLTDLESQAYIIPKDQGWDKASIRDTYSPASTVTGKHGEGLVQPSIVQLKGTSTARSVDDPLSSPTTVCSHNLLRPEIDYVSRQKLADAFMMSIDQTGAGRNRGCYPVDSPVRTLVTKNNAACIELDVEVMEKRFLEVCDTKDVDIRQAQIFLTHLLEELRKGNVEAKPWIYVYYSNGSEGMSIDSPLPACRTKAGHALIYPMVEVKGNLLRIDLLYRMLQPIELQRAMGFPDSMEWATATQTETIRAIGNSVSRGVSRALGLSWFSQRSDIREYVEHIYQPKQVVLPC